LAESSPSLLQDILVRRRLRELLWDDDWLVRTMAVGALQSARAREALPDLEQRAVVEFDDTVRASLAEALGALGGPSSLTPLRALFANGDAPARAFAIASIGQLGDIAGIRDLLRNEASARVIGIGRVALLRSGEPADVEGLCAFLSGSGEDECEVLLREISFVSEDGALGPGLCGPIETCLATITGRFPRLSSAVASTLEALKRSE
jgi:hypothetical protein